MPPDSIATKSVNGYEIKLFPTNEYGNYFKIKKNTYEYNVWVSKSPTQNCQLASMYIEGLFCAVSLNNGLRYDDNSIKRKDIQAIIKELFNMVGHNLKLLLLDVRESRIPVVEKTSIPRPGTPVQTNMKCACS